MHKYRHVISISSQNKGVQVEETVWITGRNSGIGAAITRAFAGAGYRLALTACNHQDLERTVAKMPPRPVFGTSKLAAIIQPDDLAETALYVARMNPSVAIHEIVLALVRRLSEAPAPILI